MNAFGFVEAEEAGRSVPLLYKLLLGVSRPGYYYARRNRPPSKRATSTRRSRRRPRRPTAAAEPPTGLPGCTRSSGLLASAAAKEAGRQAHAPGEAKGPPQGSEDEDHPPPLSGKLLRAWSAGASSTRPPSSMSAAGRWSAGRWPRARGPNSSWTPCGWRSRGASPLRGSCATREEECSTPRRLSERARGRGAGAVDGRAGSGRTAMPSPNRSAPR